MLPAGRHAPRLSLRQNASSQTPHAFRAASQGNAGPARLRGVTATGGRPGLAAGSCCQQYIYIDRLSAVTRSRKPPVRAVAVLRGLAADPAAWWHGYDLGRETGVQAGSLYPILMRLEDRGQLEARWEAGARPGRPARHLYRLTAAGLALAAQARPAPAPAGLRARARARPLLEGR
jgi:PadR family transcriptional regulator PadR